MSNSKTLVADVYARPAGLLAAAVASLLCGGCAVHPCDEFAGESCIELEVVAAASAALAVDRVALDATGFSLSASSSAPAGKATNLPIKIAVRPGRQFVGPFSLHGTGWLGDLMVGTGDASGRIDAAGGHTSVTLPLQSSAAPDGGVPDLSINNHGDLGVDLAGGDGAPPDRADLAGTSSIPSHLQKYTTDESCVLTVNQSIDVDTPAIDDQPVPKGCSFRLDTQPGGGEDVRVLAVGRLIILLGKTVRVSGAYPLVIVAHDSIDIAGTLDAAGHGTDHGPGGFSANNGMPEGPGAGNNGVHNGMIINGTYLFMDSGGGGGGHGSAGAIGGYVDFTPNGSPRVTVGGGFGGVRAPLVGGVLDLVLATAIWGGSSGGSTSGESPCQLPNGGAGGGGGAVQLSARGSIVISGTVNVNGGGGSGGCYVPIKVAASGGGGGAGGSIYLEAPSIALAVQSLLCANGGAGGGGADYDSMKGAASGKDGADGVPSASAAIGGTAGGQEGGTGGSGGFGATSPTVGTAVMDDQQGNGGGGGGGYGRIVIRPLDGMRPTKGAISPNPTWAQ